MLCAQSELMGFVRDAESRQTYSLLNIKRPL
jgi:hypothetical protein